jgi:hypothetical protein
MKYYIKFIYVFCAICILAPQSHAQKVGSTSMQFLHVLPSARATALGEAYCVMATGVDAVFYNPSGLALIQNQELSSTYIKWLFDTRQGAIAYALPIEGIGSFGIQLQYVDFGEFEETSLQEPYISNLEARGMTGRTFHPFSYLIGLTYATSLTDKFSTGISVKYAHESLFDGKTVYAMINSKGDYKDVNTWANGLLFDFGVRYNTGYRSVQIGASVHNFGPNVKYAVESSPVPLLFRFGIAADLIGDNALLLSQQKDNRLSTEFDLFQPNDYEQQAHVGIEYEYANTFALRGGYKINYDYEGLTLGGGLKFSIRSVQLSFDYSYGSMGTYLENVQRISLGARLQ